MKKPLQKRLIDTFMFRSTFDYEALAKQLTLEDALAKTDELFGCERILKEFDQDFKADIIVDYYTQSEWAYTLYHSEQDCIHMALNFDGVFHPDGYYAQPLAVGEQIEQLNAHKILELGCGKGFNSRFLAQRYPDVQFTGIDLTPLHVKIAQKRAINIANLSFQQGDFNQLDFPDQSFDIVFAFECLCYTPQTEILLSEIFRVLRPGGRLVVYDGYRSRPLEQLSKSLQTAVKLVEFSMGVQPGFAEIETWKSTAERVGFQIQEVEDLSFAVLPTLLKLQRLSLKLFSLTWQAKILVSLLPKYFIRNTIAALLLPLLGADAGEELAYYKLVLERPL